MLHYKTVQSRFSAETLNSDDKLAAKEAEAAAAKQDSSSASAAAHGALQGPVEHAKPNGIVPNGVVADASPQEEAGAAQKDEEERQRRRKAKGKGKARAD